MSWWVNQEKSYWDSLGWEILDFHDDEVVAPWRIVRTVGKSLEKDGLRSRDVIGSGMIVVGTAMLLPGPVDLMAAAAGVAVFKSPAGAIVGVVVYNVAALSLMAGGAALIAS